MENTEKVVRTEEQIGAECQAQLLELGRNVYQQWLLKESIDNSIKKIYQLNVEAFKLRANQLSEQEPSNG